METVHVPLHGKYAEGRVAIIDASDAELVMVHRWVASVEGSKKNRLYARSYCAGRVALKMHRFILCAPDGMHVDHINNDGLDNRRSNLRLVTPGQNNANTGKRRSGHSQFKGVSRKNSAWIADLRSGDRRWRRSFPSEEIAARAYDIKAAEFNGEFARLNFPSELEYSRELVMRSLYVEAMRSSTIHR